MRIKTNNKVNCTRGDNDGAHTQVPQLLECYSGAETPVVHDTLLARITTADSEVIDGTYIDIRISLCVLIAIVYIAAGAVAAVTVAAMVLLHGSLTDIHLVVCTACAAATNNTI